MQSPHIPVMLNEVLAAFSEIKNGVILDCTLGYAGHSLNILENNQNIELIACDRDIEAINFSTQKLTKFANRIKIIKTNFANIFSQIKDENISGILADIGVSSLQLDKNERGFSLKSEILDMRMDKDLKLSAKDILNSYPKEELERIFRDYGELPNYKDLAQKVLNFRQNQNFQTTQDFLQIIGNQKLKNRQISLSTLAFQALRIEVNQELTELEILLKSIENSKIKTCIVAIITFHSLEDRIVKNFFKKWSSSCLCPPEYLRCQCDKNHKIGEILTKKPLTPSQEEIKNNPRSSCAKLRIFKIDR